MPRSVLTLTLTSAAHSLGDEYYRRQTKYVWSRDGADDSFGLAISYLTALETLREHLLNLEKDSYTEKLIEDTDEYLRLLRRDLDRLERERNFATRHAA